MSSVRLKKDHPLGKEGQIVSVPFGTGKDMIREGLAEYPQAQIARPARTALPELVAMQQTIANLQGQVADRDKTIADLQGQIESLTSPKKNK